jgi:UDP-N-acetylglucosamine:LPS N-acetylglucosamine transferase
VTSGSATSRLAGARRSVELASVAERSDGNGQADLLLICTGGGHLLQLWSLKPAWEGFSRSWIVSSFEESDVRSLLQGEHVEVVGKTLARNAGAAVKNLLLAWRVLRRVRPHALLTTGAAIAVPFVWVARLQGIPVVWVETLSRTDKPSLSCRLSSPAATRLYVQWPELRRALPRARYVGTVFSGR